MSATLISALFELGADIHVALPDYRNMFGAGIAPLQIKKLDAIRRKMPAERIHLAEDRAFFYLDRGGTLITEMKMEKFLWHFREK